MKVAMAKHGFPYSVNREQEHVSSGAFQFNLKTLKRHLDAILGFLRDETPVAVSRVTLYPGRAFHPVATDVIINIDGPIKAEFSVAGSYFDGPTSINGISVVGQTYSKPGRAAAVTGACIESMIDLYYDRSQLQWWIDFFWYRFRLLDPSLQYWSSGESIFDKNPQLLDPNHPIRECVTAFWTPSIWSGTTKRTDVGSSADRIAAVYCRQHDRMEYASTNLAKMIQLVAGFFTHQQWADVAFGKVVIGW